MEFPHTPMFCPALTKIKKEGNNSCLPVFDCRERLELLQMHLIAGCCKGMYSEAFCRIRRHTEILFLPIKAEARPPISLRRKSSSEEVNNSNVRYGSSSPQYNVGHLYGRKAMIGPSGMQKSKRHIHRTYPTI